MVNSRKKNENGSWSPPRQKKILTSLIKALLFAKKRKPHWEVERSDRSLERRWRDVTGPRTGNGETWQVRGQEARRPRGLWKWKQEPEPRLGWFLVTFLFSWVHFILLPPSFLTNHCHLLHGPKLPIMLYPNYHPMATVSLFLERILHQLTCLPPLARWSVSLAQERTDYGGSLEWNTIGQAMTGILTQ